MQPIVFRKKKLPSHNCLLKIFFIKDMSPEQVIQKQVEAYNSRDIESFVACHHLNVKLYTFPESTPFAVGQDRIKEIYSDVFDSSPTLHTKILNRMSFGNTVIDHEIVTGRKGIDRLELIAIYQVEAEQIISARFVRQ